jgi:NADH dehydrogenase
VTESPAQLDVVTGAFSNSGAAIARELISRGHRVLTLTGHPGSAPAGTPIMARPLALDDPVALRQSLMGAHTLYNTYWARFPRRAADHEAAAARCRALFRAAASAGVRRIVHVPVLHPGADSPYSYFRGKALAERELAGTAVPYAIARPALLFGGTAELLNNVAWLLRHLPVFAIGGRGDYRVRGIHVDDLARLCADLGARQDNPVVDAVGPQSLAFRDLVVAVSSAVGSRSRLVGVPGAALPPLALALGLVLRDTLLTREEFRAMADGLADSDGPATGRIRLTDWIREHGPELGRRYANHTRRRPG